MEDGDSHSCLQMFRVCHLGTDRQRYKIHAYDHGCINCGSPPVLGDATYQTLDNVTTIDSEAVVNCSSGKQLPDGSTTVTMKCTWDASTDSYKWVANTGSMNFSVSSSLSWQIKINGEGRRMLFKIPVHIFIVKIDVDRLHYSALESTYLCKQIF